MEKVVNLDRTPVTKTPAEQANPLARIEELLAELVTETRKVKAKGRISADLALRWLSTPRAAEYCGYSLDMFREYAKDYRIPKHGPKLNRYDVQELDEWMREPSCFLNIGNEKLVRPGGTDPISL